MGVQEKYVKALINEIKFYAGNFSSCSLSSIYFGGGTPSFLDPLLLERILNVVKEKFTLFDDCEITMVMNPGSVSKESVKIYKRCGINRASVGLQSANDDELKLLGRVHDFDQFLKTYEILRACDVENVNIDVRNLSDSYTVQGLSAEDIKVTVNVKGVSSVLSNLSSDDIIAYIDLKNFNSLGYIFVDGMDGKYYIYGNGNEITDMIDDTYEKITFPRHDIIEINKIFGDCIENTWHIPSKVFNADRHHQLEFLAGVIDANDALEYKPYPNFFPSIMRKFHSVNIKLHFYTKEIALQIMMLAQMLGMQVQHVMRLLDFSLKVTMPPYASLPATVC